MKQYIEKQLRDGEKELELFKRKADKSKNQKIEEME